mgnify:CR=1 FL=1
MLPAITLDCDMSADDVLLVLARYGLWIDDRHPAARQRIEPLATRLHLAYDDVAAQLRADPSRFGAAIRRQWGTSVLWYARPVTEVLQRCDMEPPDQLLISVLNLHEPDSTPPIELRGDGDTLLPPGVIMDKGTPVGVSLPRPRMDTAAVFRGDREFRGEPAGAAPTIGRGAGPQPAAPSAPSAPPAQPAPPAPPKIVEAWPRVEAPSSVTAGTVFEVVVGFGASQQEGLHGGQVRLPAPPGQEWIDVVVEVTATPAVQAPDGWSRTMKVALNDPTSAQVSFRLVGTTPTNREQIWLTMLEVRYLVAGTVCGTAMRPLAVFSAGSPPAAGGRPVGDEVRDVLRANEEPLEFVAELGAEGSVGAGPDLESRVVEQGAGVLGESALVGECDAKHESGEGALERGRRAFRKRKRARRIRRAPGRRR